MTDKRKKPENRYWGDRTPPESKLEFFNAVTTLAPDGEGSVATIRMYGPIDSWGGWWGVSASEVSAVLDALPDSVTDVILRINSPGGEVFEGIAILNLLRAHKAKITAVVDGLAASAASVIAAGADETVMSPGTQMMIHSPWTITWGSAADLRKDAERLDGIELSLVEIYSAKAGEKDWAELLAEETWMTATETVEFGLADRVGVVQDQGATSTVGDDEELVLIGVTPAGDEDSARVQRLTGVAAAAAVHKLPSSSEPGDPNQKEALMSSDTIKAGLRERLGVTDAAASDEQLLAALDQVIDQATTPPAPAASAVPAGTTLIDSDVLASLQADAAAGREALDAQTSARRDALVSAAIADGRIAPANRETWRAQLDSSEETTTALLASLPKNTIPVTEVGHSDDVATAEDAMYAKAWGADKQKEA